LPAADALNAARARPEMTWPMVFASRRASSLAAARTSSSISSVVLMDEKPRRSGVLSFTPALAPRSSRECPPASAEQWLSPASRLAPSHDCDARSRARTPSSTVPTRLRGTWQSPWTTVERPWYACLGKAARGPLSLRGASRRTACQKLGNARRPVLASSAGMPESRKSGIPVE
jgi:hypothetical protein